MGPLAPIRQGALKVAKWGIRSLVVARDKSCQLCERTRDLSSSGQGGQPVLLGPSGLEEHIAWSDCTYLVRPKHKTDSKQKTTKQPNAQITPVNEPSLGGRGGSFPFPHTKKLQKWKLKVSKIKFTSGLPREYLSDKGNESSTRCIWIARPYCTLPEVYKYWLLYTNSIVWLCKKPAYRYNRDLCPNPKCCCIFWKLLLRWHSCQIKSIYPKNKYTQKLKWKVPFIHKQIIIGDKWR